VLSLWGTEMAVEGMLVLVLLLEVMLEGRLVLLLLL
jgi:hypothetical protein